MKWLRAWRVFAPALLLFVTPAARAHDGSSLRPGDVGAQVAAWQRMLNALPNTSILEDGVFGPRTERATLRFERRSGDRQADGVVTTEDRILWLGGFLTGSGAIKPDLYQGMRDPRVGHLQVALNAWIERAEAGLNPLWIDTIFGPRTEAAVRAYQSSAGITVDGIAGPRTWDELSKAGLLQFPPPGYP